MTALPTVPDGYQAITPWVIVDGVPAFIDFLSAVFDAKEIIRMLAAGTTTPAAEAAMRYVGETLEAEMQQRGS